MHGWPFLAFQPISLLAVVSPSFHLCHAINRLILVCRQCDLEDSTVSQRQRCHIAHAEPVARRLVASTFLSNAPGASTSANMRRSLSAGRGRGTVRLRGHFLASLLKKLRTPPRFGGSCCPLSSTVRSALPSLGGCRSRAYAYAIAGQAHSFRRLKRPSR